MAGTSRRHEGVFVKISDVQDWASYRIFDVRFDLANPQSGKVSYMKGHVPGATFVDLDNELCSTITSTSGRHPLPRADDFVEWCKARGVTNVPVLCYDDKSGAMGACRLWWMLDSLGVEVYVLEGGYPAYVHHKLPIEIATEERQVSIAAWNFNTTFNHLYSIKDIPIDGILVDARDTTRFSSTVRPIAVDDVPGHIQGAKNLPFVSHLVSQNSYLVLRDTEALRSNILLTLNGAWGQGKPDLSHCIFYCGSGVTGTFNIATVHHIGLGKPYLYCGSWSEYSSIYRDPITRRIITEHGFFCEMMSPNLTSNPKANPSVMNISVDGMQIGNPEQRILDALEHLHQGEECRVHFPGKTVHIKIS